MRKKYSFVFVLMLFSFIAESQIVDTLKEVSIFETRLLSPSKSFTTVAYDSLILDKYQFSEISEVLSQEAGFYIKNSGPNGLSTLSVRGLSASHTKIFWNGISITSPTLGLSDLSLIPTFFYDQVNVNVGGASLMNGTGAIGGSVNLINDNIMSKGSKILLGIKYNPALNSKEKYFTHQVNGKKFGLETKLLYQDAVNDFKYNEKTPFGNIQKNRENADLKRYGLSQNYYFKINQKQDLSLNVIYLMNDKNLPSPLFTANNNQNQTDKIFRNHIGWKYLAKNIFHKAGVAYFIEKSQFDDPVAFIDSEFQITTIASYYQMGHSLSKKLNVGLNINNDLHRISSSGFEDIEEQNRLSILATLAYENKLRWGSIVSFRNEMLDGSSHDLSPSIGIYAQPLTNKKYKVKANLARNIRTPSLNDLYWELGGNSSLLDEQAMSGEIGLEYNDENHTQVDITYFTSATDNWIQWVPQNNSIWQPVNLKKVKSEGLELSLKYKGAQESVINKTIGLNYRYSLTQNVEGSDESKLVGKELIYAPQNQLSVNMSFGIGSVNLRYAQKITSKVFVDAANETYLPYHAPASISVNYQAIDDHYEGLSFEITMNNVFNEEYQVVANQPIPLRNIFVMMQLHF